MNIVERAKNICLAPTKEWEVIEGESTPAANLVGSYVAPLVAIGAIAGFIGGSIIGRTIPFIGTYRVGIVPGVIGAVFVFLYSGPCGKRYQPAHAAAIHNRESRGESVDHE